MKSYSNFVTENVSVLNLFFNTIVLFINRLTLVCYGFKVLNHITSKQWFDCKPYLKKQASNGFDFKPYLKNKQVMVLIVNHI